MNILPPDSSAPVALDGRPAHRRKRGRASIGVMAGCTLLTLAIDSMAGPRTAPRTTPRSVVRACTIRWSPAETLKSAANRPVVVDAFVVAVWGSRMVLVGRMAFETNDRGQIVPVAGALDDFIQAGVVLGDDGRATLIPLPVDSAISGPRLMVLNDTAVMMAFVHQDGVESLTDGIWLAEFDGIGWTAPRRIYDGVDLFWGISFGSELVLHEGDVLFAAGSSELAPDSGILLFRRVRGDWRTIPIRAEWAHYVQLTVVPGDTLLVAAIHAEAPHGNTLFAQRFDLEGSPLGPRVRVSPPEVGPVVDLRLRVAGDSSIHLLWTTWSQERPAPPGDSGMQRLHLAHSMDNGASWVHHEGPAIDVRRGGGVDAMIDSRGTLNVVTTVFRDSVPHPRIFSWYSGGWHVSEPPRVQDGFAMNTPFLLERGTDSLRLIWRSLRASDMLRQPGVLLTSIGVRACPGPSGSTLQ